MQISELRLEEIIAQIPPLLLPKFKRLGVNTVAEVMAIDPNEFAQMRGIGGNSVHLLVGLQEELKNTPQKFIEHIETERASLQEKVATDKTQKSRNALPTMIPDSIDAEIPFLHNFVDFEEQYSRLSNEWGEQQARNHAIVRRLFGIHCQPMNMEQVGTYYDITRERVRQIKDRSLAGIRDMLSGVTLRKPLRKCPIDLVSQFLSFMHEQIANKGILIRKSLLDSITNPASLSNPHLDLLMESIGYESAVYRECDLFFYADRFSHQILNDSITAITQTLRDEVYPVDDFGVVIKIKKEFRGLGLTNEIIQNILEAIPEYEYVTVHGRSGYQLRFDRLATAGAMAMRILRDNTKSMHFKDITREINKRLSRYDTEKIVTDASVTVQLVSSELTSPIGRTGYWTLTEWGENTDSIRDLMVKALRAQGEAMTVENLGDAVAEMRPEVRRESISSLLGLYTDTFVRLKSGKVALPDWRIDKREIRTGSVHYDAVDDTELMGIIIDIIRKGENEVCSRKWLREKLKAQGYQFSNTMFYSRITKYPILEPVVGSRTDIKLLEGVEIPTQSQSQSHATTITDRICIKAEQIIRENGGLVLLSVVVKQILNESDCKRPSIYKALSTNGFEKSEVDGKILISLNTQR